MGKLKRFLFAVKRPELLFEKFAVAELDIYFTFPAVFFFALLVFFLNKPAWFKTFAENVAGLRGH